MDKKLDGRKIAILVADGFEQVEMTEPRKALETAGAKTDLIGLENKKVQGMNHHDKGDQFPVDRELKQARVEDYDALLPGGVANPDKLRTIPEAVQFAKDFAAAGKPIAAICHGPWLLVEANLVKDRRMTSWPSLKTDIRNAGGQWEDSQVVADHGIVTSRKPDDIPAFNQRMIEEFASAQQPVAAH